MMNNDEPRIHAKDLIMPPIITARCSLDGNKPISLGESDAVNEKDSSAFFSSKDGFLNLNITCGENSFFDYQSGATNPRKDLHKQGNTIALYIQPPGKTNFYRFEYSAKGKQTLHYYGKTRSGKYKPRKIKNDWEASQQVYEQEDFWIVEFNIPLNSCGLGNELEGMHFLIVRYRYSSCSASPVVTNSMCLPANQLLTPEKWNVITSNLDDQTPQKKLDEMIRRKSDQCSREIMERSDNQEDLAAYYTNLLDKIYEKCDNLNYNETFRRLARFVNLREFWENDQKLATLCHQLADIHQLEAHKLFDIIHLIMVGATLLAEKDLQERQNERHNHEYKRLEQEKTAKRKNKTVSDSTIPDSALLPCFLVIKEKEEKGIRFGRLGALRYIYEHCPRRHWKIGFSAFRKKYAQWDELSDKNPRKKAKVTTTCSYNLKCKEFKPEL